jgi:DNA-binding winged helix-turn-helix (wHTH) protein
MSANEFQSGRNYAIGEDVVFDVLNDRLVRVGRDTHHVQLKPVAARLLQQFVDAPRTVVGRRQLLDRNWRAYGMEVCENSLNQAIHTLREAFQAIDPDHLYLKTIPRIGYALVVDVQPVTVSQRTWDSRDHDGTPDAFINADRAEAVCCALS